MDRFERQRAFHTQILQQSGGGLDPQTPVEPLNLISTPLWIDAVAEWEFANAISLPNYVKQVILWTAVTWSALCKTDCNAPWIACWPRLLTCTIKTVSRVGITRQRIARWWSPFGCPSQSFGSSPQQQRTIWNGRFVSIFYHTSPPFSSGNRVIKIFKQKKKPSLPSEMTMFCIVLGPSSPPKPRWTNTLNGDPSKKEDKSKESKPCYSMRKQTSLLVLVGTKSWLSLVPHHPSTSTRSSWSTRTVPFMWVVLDHPQPNNLFCYVKKQLRCHHQSPRVYRVQLYVCPLLQTLQPQGTSSL